MVNQCKRNLNSIHIQTCFIIQFQMINMSLLSEIPDASEGSSKCSCYWERPCWRHILPGDFFQSFCTEHKLDVCSRHCHIISCYKSRKTVSGFLFLKKNENQIRKEEANKHFDIYLHSFLIGGQEKVFVSKTESNVREYRACCIVTRCASYSKWKASVTHKLLVQLNTFLGRPILG